MWVIESAENKREPNVNVVVDVLEITLIVSLAYIVFVAMPNNSICKIRILLP